MMEDDGVSMLSVSNGSTGCEYHGTLYVKHVISVLRKQAELCKEDEISFQPAE